MLDPEVFRASPQPTSDRRIRAIRLFQDPAGWTPHYTDSGVDRGFEPVCLGPAQVGGRGAASG